MSELWFGKIGNNENNHNYNHNSNNNNHLINFMHERAKLYYWNRCECFFVSFSLSLSVLVCMSAIQFNSNLSIAALLDTV